DEGDLVWVALIHGSLHWPESGRARIAAHEDAPAQERARAHRRAATVLFHPDCYRRPRPRTGSADLADPRRPHVKIHVKRKISTTARGLAWHRSCAHAYRRWGLPPRPENVCRPDHPGDT